MKYKLLVGIGLAFASLTFSYASVDAQFGNINDASNQNLSSKLQSAQTVTINPGEKKEIRSWGCGFWAKAYLTVYSSNAYPLGLELDGDWSASTTGTANKDGDYVSLKANNIETNFKAYVTNKTDQKVTASVNAHC